MVKPNTTTIPQIISNGAEIVRKAGLLLTAALSSFLLAGVGVASTGSSDGAAGDVTEHSVVLWARSDVPGKVKFTVTGRDKKSGKAKTKTIVSDPCKGPRS